MHVVPLWASAMAWSSLPPRLPVAASRARQVSLVMVELEPPPSTFEPQGDPTQLAILLGVVALPFAYWWYITVPEARLALSKDKRFGETADFIVDLAESEEARPVERWFFAKWLAKQPRRRERSPPSPTETRPLPADGTAAEEDSQPVPTASELFRPASLAGNATPRFWSGDNPIVVTMGALLAAGIVAAASRGSNALAFDGVLLGAGLAFGLTRLDLK